MIDFRLDVGLIKDVIGCQAVFPKHWHFVMGIISGFVSAPVLAWPRRVIVMRGLIGILLSLAG